MLSLTARVCKGLLLALIGFFTTSGCIYLGVGAIGAVGGYMVSPDTVEGVVNGSFQDIWGFANEEIVRHQGQVLATDPTGGFLQADLDGTEVTVQLTPGASADAWKVSVKARKNMFPKVRLAQAIYTNIYNAASSQ